MIRKFERHKRALKRQSGFSFMEVMLVAMVFVFIVAGIYSVSVLGDKYWQANRTKIELQQELRKAMDRMIHELRQASDASIVNLPAGSTNTTITFKIPVGVVGGTTLWSTDTIQFVLGGTSGRQLLRVEGANTNILAQDLTSLEFTRNATTPDILEISMEAEKDSAMGHTITETFNFEAQLRN